MHHRQAKQLAKQPPNLPTNQCECEDWGKVYPLFETVSCAESLFAAFLCAKLFSTGLDWQIQPFLFRQESFSTCV